MFSTDYWFQPNPGPLTAKAWLFYAACMLVFLACLAWSSGRLLGRQIRRRKTMRTGRSGLPAGTGFLAPGLVVVWFELGVGLAGLALIGARLALVPGWSARIWPVILVGLAAASPAAVYIARRPPGPFDHILKLLVLRHDELPLWLPWQLALWALHLAGLSLWVHVAGWPPWSAGVLWAVLLVCQGLVAILLAARPSATPVIGRVSLDAAPLTPLLAAYASAGLHLLFGLRPEHPFPLPFHPTLTELGTLPFYFGSMSAAAILYTLLVELALIKHRIGSKPFCRRCTIISYAIYSLPVLLAVVSLGWMAFELFTYHTHGVTGTDAYGYTQVAIDLAVRGTALHRFPLFSYVADLDIAWAPLVPLGYHLPLNEAGDAAMVWPLGMSFLLALGFRLAGESGLYLTGPIVALLAAVATGWLTAIMVHAASRTSPVGAAGGARSTPTALNQPEHQITRGPDWLISACLALFLWATSFEVIDRSLVPMADAAAALFTVLVWLALLKVRLSTSHTAAAWWALTAGIALGLAFTVRYTQLMLVASVAVGLGLPATARWQQRGQWLVIAGLGALVTALPDIVYRWEIFGTPLANPQMYNLTLFAPSNIIPMAIRVGSQLFAGREFGLLSPFLLAGIIWQWQRDRFSLATMAAGALAVIGLQLPYGDLRLRDLLALLPLLAGWTGLGLAWAWQILSGARLQVEAGVRRVIYILAAAAIFLWLLLPVMRVEPLISHSRQPHAASFGYVTSAERTALAKLAALTPAPAAIGTHLNAGAIVLYAGRWPFQPGGWSEPALDYFLTRMATSQVPVFLLDDGPSVRPAIARLAAAGRLEWVARLDVPLPPEGGTGQLYRVLSK